MALCEQCGNFDDSHLLECGIESKEYEQKEEYQPDLYFYWHGDIEEDYDMGEYDCLCEICFDINNSEGKITWKDDKNPFECASL